jgi:predicted RNase H-like HicB family nuclease
MRGVYSEYMKSYTYRVIIEPDGDAYHGYVPSLPGCHTHGATIEETRMYLRDAMSLYLEQLAEEKSDIPQETGLESFETVSIGVSTHA